jgi:hypothetical protein
LSLIDILSIQGKHEELEAGEGRSMEEGLLLDS